MSIDVGQLVNEIKTAASGVLTADIATVRGFSQRQLEAIALQTHVVATGIATNNISPELQDFFLDGLKDMVTNFTRTLKGLMAVTIEKIWNAVVGAVWNALSTAIGTVLPIPKAAGTIPAP
jgi:hypothetical protein